MSGVFSGSFDGVCVYLNVEGGEVAADISGEFDAVELPRDPAKLRELAELLLEAAESAEA